MKNLKPNCGTIYIVATPIGNLDDITIRAVQTLKKVDLILAEDTRHATILLQHYQISTRCESFHAYNEQAKAEKYFNMVQNGAQLALISDAGTPLINDPGYPLVNAAQKLQIPVIPIPGPCALICALSAAGVPTDNFSFHGFPPAKTANRKSFFTQLSNIYNTTVFYESTHRLIGSLRDLATIFDSAQPIVLAKELTKAYEEIKFAPIQDIIAWLENDPNRLKGEFVIIIPARSKPNTNEEEAVKLLTILLPHVGAKQAAQIGSQLLNLPKNQLYQLALQLHSR